MNEKTVNVKLYTFEEMKDLVAQASANSAMEALEDDGNDNETKMRRLFVETIIGSKIMDKMDEMHERGEI